MSQPDVQLDAQPGAEKPSRTFTKRMTVLNVCFAWAAIAGSIVLGREMADLIVPMMVVLIATLLGVYQGVGHFDLRAMRGPQA